MASYWWTQTKESGTQRAFFINLALMHHGIYGFSSDSGLNKWCLYRSLNQSILINCSMSTIFKQNKLPKYWDGIGELIQIIKSYENL